MASPLSQPIPGQSLTDTPKAAPWERPPEMVEPRDILEYYIKKLDDDELMQDLSVVFELGGDLKTVVSSLTLIEAQKGTHTVDAGMIVAPMVATYIKLAMNELGIEPKETNRDYKKEATEREEKRLRLLIADAIEKDAADGGTSSGILEELSGQEPAEAPMEEPMEEPAIETEQPEEPMGLMSKGTV